MRPNLALAAFITGINALVSRDDKCCFHLTAYGGPDGAVGQISDGQNRIGQSGLPTGQYCIDPSGGLTDDHGRGCILTPPTTQWQCDAGAGPTPGFSVGSNGTLTYKSSNTFWSCPTGENGGHNIYVQPVQGEPGCRPIWLEADSCRSAGIKTTTSTLPCSTTSAAATAPPKKPDIAPPKAPFHASPKKASCPAELNGAWEFPHLIVPVNSSAPEKTYGTSFNGTVGGPMSSIFNFDIPETASGKSCSLSFLFPNQSQLETSAYTYSGAGKFKVGILAGVANKQTTYANSPHVAMDFGTFDLKPGTKTDLGSCPDGCPAGQAVSFVISPVADSMLDYFQDSNPCPIGLYVTVA